MDFDKCCSCKTGILLVLIIQIQEGAAISRVSFSRHSSTPGEKQKTDVHNVTMHVLNDGQTTELSTDRTDKSAKVLTSSVSANADVAQGLPSSTSQPRPPGLARRATKLGSVQHGAAAVVMDSLGEIRMVASSGGLVEPSVDPPPAPVVAPAQAAQPVQPAPVPAQAAPPVAQPVQTGAAPPALPAQPAQPVPVPPAGQAAQPAQAAPVATAPAVQPGQPPPAQPAQPAAVQPTPAAQAPQADTGGSFLSAVLLIGGCVLAVGGLVALWGYIQARKRAGKSEAFRGISKRPTLSHAGSSRANKDLSEDQDSPDGSGSSPGRDLKQDSSSSSLKLPDASGAPRTSYVHRSNYQKSKGGTASASLTLTPEPQSKDASEGGSLGSLKAPGASIPSGSYAGKYKSRGGAKAVADPEQVPETNLSDSKDGHEF